MKVILQFYRPVLLALFILVLSVIPIKSSAGSALFEIPYSDKIAHFILYGLLSFLIVFELNRINASLYKVVLLPLGICLFYGGIIELIQMFLAARSGEFLDIVANFTGSLMAILFFFILKKLFANQMSNSKNTN